MRKETSAEDTEAPEWDRKAAQGSLDELFQLARKYTNSKDYHDLMQFIGRFRRYSPFNAMLAHIQMPGARYVAPAGRWRRDYQRRIKPGARPIALLQPKGPVMFVFDVSDVEPLPDAPDLPKHVTNPFEVSAGKVGNQMEKSKENAKRDGVRVAEYDAGSQHGGQISEVEPGAAFRFWSRSKDEYRYIDVRYELLLSAKLSSEMKYAVLTHELGHLYCGHLGTPNAAWWPDRSGLSKTVREFEAESVAFLVCRRLGIKNSSEEYLSGYVKGHPSTPAISLDCVLKASRLIEQMGREQLRLRGEKAYHGRGQLIRGHRASWNSSSRSSN